MASNSHKDFPADDRAGSAENKKSKVELSKRKLKIKKSKKTSPTATPGHGTGFLADPFNFSAILNNPSIKELAEQLQKTSHGATQDGLPNFDDHKYFSTMQQVMENPTFMFMAERLGNALMQDPSVSSTLEIFTNPSNEGQLKKRTARINADPYLKHILDEIEDGGPAVMMRYWNDEEVFQKLGLAMGIPPSSGDAVASSENFETEDMGNEESINKELSLNILKLHLVDLLFRRVPREPLNYYWCGYQRALSGHSRVKSGYSRDKSGHSRAKSGHSRAKSSTLTDKPRDQETQVAGSEALLTMLARVKEEKPCVRFTLELVLVLFVYHSLCNMDYSCNPIELEDKVAKGNAILARGRAIWAEILLEMQLEA